MWVTIDPQSTPYDATASTGSGKVVEILEAVEGSLDEVCFNFYSKKIFTFWKDEKLIWCPFFLLLVYECYREEWTWRES